MSLTEDTTYNENEDNNDNCGYVNYMYGIYDNKNDDRDNTKDGRGKLQTLAIFVNM